MNQSDISRILNDIQADSAAFKVAMRTVAYEDTKKLCDTIDCFTADCAARFVGLLDVVKCKNEWHVNSEPGGYNCCPDCNAVVTNTPHPGERTMQNYFTGEPS